jgi:hypothetical protein
MTWVRAWLVSLTSVAVGMCVVTVPGVAAHPGHNHASDRIPGERDFQRIGKVEVRFHPEKGSYSYKRPGEPPLWFHRDVPSVNLIGGDYDLPTEEEPVVCATTGHRIKILYGRASYPATPTPAEVDAIRLSVRRMNWKILSESLRSSGNTRALRMRVDCNASGQINVWSITAFATPSNIWEELEDEYGYPSGSESVKNLVFYDGGGASASGVAQMANDSIKSNSDFANGSRSRTSSGVVYRPADGSAGTWGYWDDHTTLHELFHTMGAVNSNAPYGTEKNHCTDGLDIMCYDDDSVPFWEPQYSETRCPTSAGYGTPVGTPLDCSYDSYFDAAEESGEWLNTHWNTGGSENPFLVQAPSPTTPTVTTTPATNVFNTSATINGSITPNGLPTQYYFQYGTSTTYGATTGSGSVTSNLYGNTAVTKSLVATLQPGTTYHFRLVASNALGTSYGPDRVFTTPVWAIKSTPNPAGAADSYLYAVGCEPSSANMCMAVGKSTTSGGADTLLAERWDGSSWALAPAVVPSGATASALNAVTCPAATSCTAVGSYSTGSGTLALAEVWNGTSWTIQAAANAAGASTTVLTGVSCPSGTTGCTAVGYAVTGGVRSAIAERWNGTSWSMQSVPLPSGSSSSEFESVGCRSTSFCMAVGRYTDSGGRIRSLSAVWNGSAWSLKTVPDPTGATKSVLLDVTCTGTAVLCTAAGGYYDASNVQQTLLVRWSGTAWAVQSSPNPSGAAASVLQGVHCSNAGSNPCVAVGDWASGSTNVTLAEWWDGSTWSLDPTPNVVGSVFNALWDVSCRINTCIAVGWTTNTSGDAKTLAQIR